MNLVSVITSVNPPSPAVRALASLCPGSVIVVGDTKTPANWEHHGVDFYSVERQGTLGLSLPSRLKPAHYARKNIGYLQAMRAGAECIYDTDDDNEPSDAWRERQLSCSAQAVTERGWCNVYRYFHPTEIWPRGFALAKLANDQPKLADTTSIAECPIQQGLADGEADVDAIWRLAALPHWMRGRFILFRDKKSVVLGNGAWCPFNSQTTWWFEEAFPLLYLPTYATFRMTDIWRSFVAQRCLWELGRGVAFHSPSEVVQKRNEHDLMKDFEDEVPGYLANEKIVSVLESTSLSPGAGAVTANLLYCYETLVDSGFLPPDELDGVRAWVDDVEKIRTGVR